MSDRERADARPARQQSLGELITALPRLVIELLKAELAHLKETGRATYAAVTDREALEGFRLLSRLEGIIPALETSHAVSWIAANRGRWAQDEPVLRARGEHPVRLGELLGRQIVGHDADVCRIA